VTPALTYVYCLVRRAGRPPLHDLPPGIPGSKEVRALAAGRGVWLIVTSVRRADYDETSLAKGLQDLDWVGTRAMAHESIVEQFLTSPAVLPMQLFALFMSDDRALEHVAQDRARIDRILTRIERHLEWGLRLSFDEKAARQAVEEKAVSRARSSHGPTGAGYLARKRDLLDVTRVQFTAAKAEADRLYRAMSREASEARRRTATEQSATPGSRLLLDAAFLVPARRAAPFRSALRRYARKLDAAGIVVSLTGPWPPYNFIEPASAKASADRPAAKAPSSARATAGKPAGKPASAERSATAKTRAGTSARRPARTAARATKPKTARPLARKRR
jgi:hypothetical protein